MYTLVLDAPSIIFQEKLRGGETQKTKTVECQQVAKGLGAE